MSGQEKVPVIIMFRGRQDLGLVNSLGGRVKSVYKFQPAVAADMPEAAVDALGRNPSVQYVVRDLEMELVQTMPWGVERIGAPTVHVSGNKGAGVNVAILDSGIDTDHLDLSYEFGYDFSGLNDADPEDYDGHGTHVAGTVAASDNTVGVVGVAPEVNLYILKVFTDNGAGYYSDTAEALEWCIGTHSDDDPENDIQIISMSFGSKAAYGDPGIEPWINDAYDFGILLVGAAGNEGNSPGRGDNVIYPARYEDVIAVAATGESDERAKWSSTGPSVELSAPGVSIHSTYLGGGYAYASGTSMACPHVSGTAALILGSDEGAWASLGYTNGDGSWSNTEVRKVLAMMADDLGSTGRDEKYGYGLVDADEAAAAPGEDTTPPTISDLTPADGATVNTATPTISATVTDASNIDESSIVMTLNGVKVAHTYENGLVSYTPDLSEGLYTVTLDVSDTIDNLATTSWSFTVDTTSPAQVMHVASIEMSLDRRTAGRNTFEWAIATVTIVDSGGNPVEGATVYGHWEGATADTDTGLTNAIGEVSLKSDSVKNPPSETTFTFVVDNVVLSGWTYDPFAN